MNIVEFDEFREKINEIKEACDFLPDVSTTEGYEKSKRVALDVGKVLTQAEKVRVARKAHFLEGGKEVDKQAKALVSELTRYSSPHKIAYKGLDAAKKQRELDRVSALEERVRAIRDLPEAMRDMSSVEIQGAMESLQTEECEGFYEFTQEALKARNASRSALGDLFTVTTEREKQSAELEELRKAKELRDTEDRDQRIADDAVERERQAAESIKLATEVAQLKREKDVEHIGNVRRTAKEAIIKLGFSDEAAKNLVLAIHGGKIPNVSIRY